MQSSNRNFNADRNFGGRNGNKTGNRNKNGINGVLNGNRNKGGRNGNDNGITKVAQMETGTEMAMVLNDKIEITQTPATEPEL